MDWSPYLAPLDRYPRFSTDESFIPRFQYAGPPDAGCRALRARYNLPDIAGTGKTFERVTAVMQWVHRTLTHPGAPRVIEPATPDHIIETCTATRCGLFCAQKAIVLTAALLALGIRARQLSCLPYAFDGDCHVVTLVWLPEWRRWVLCDPTFNTWFVDSDGTPLSPVDIRQRYLSRIPPSFRPISLPNTAGLFLNGVECATYDEWYGAYMAKNCFRFSSPLLSTCGDACPEGACVFLDPVGYTDRSPYDSIARITYRTNSQTAFWEGA